MSKLITNTLRHTSGSADNITLDSSQNVTVEGNLTVDGTTTLTGAVELPDDTVDIADLSASGTASSSTYLRGDNSWAAVSSVGGATGVDFNDDVKVRFGSDQDLDVWHDGTDGQVDLSTGYLKIRDVTNSRDIAKFHSTNSQEFYMNGTKRLEVTNTGISVTGNLTTSSGIYVGGAGGSNHLDDYEEGTWTPDLTGTWTNKTVQRGSYVKVGNFVICTFMIACNTNTASANCGITGLPFQIAYASGEGRAGGAPAWCKGFDLSTGQMVMSGIGNATQMLLYRLADNANAVTVAWSSCEDNVEFGGTFAYTIG